MRSDVMRRSDAMLFAGFLVDGEGDGDGDGNRKTIRNTSDGRA